MIGNTATSAYGEFATTLPPLPMAKLTSLDAPAAKSIITNESPKKIRKYTHVEMRRNVCRTSQRAISSQVALTPPLQSRQAPLQPLQRVLAPAGPACHAMQRSTRPRD